MNPLNIPPLLWSIIEIASGSVLLLLMVAWVVHIFRFGRRPLVFGAYPLRSYMYLWLLRWRWRSCMYEAGLAEKRADATIVGAPQVLRHERIPRGVRLTVRPRARGSSAQALVDAERQLERVLRRDVTVEQASPDSVYLTLYFNPIPMGQLPDE